MQLALPLMKKMNHAVSWHSSWKAHIEKVKHLGSPSCIPGLSVGGLVFLRGIYETIDPSMEPQLKGILKFEVDWSRSVDELSVICCTNILWCLQVKVLESDGAHFHGHSSIVSLRYIECLVWSTYCLSLFTCKKGKSRVRSWENLGNVILTDSLFLDFLDAGSSSGCLHCG